MFYFLSLNMLNNNQNWTPSSSIEEKIKKFLIPGKFYLNHLKRKHLKKVRMNCISYVFLFIRVMGQLILGLIKECTVQFWLP